MLPVYGGTSWGKGGTRSGLSLQGGGAFLCELKGNLCSYTFRRYLKAAMFMKLIKETTDFYITK